MRDKVKRFISILMTALMLVNLLPVGALAEGFTISNSVQSIGWWDGYPVFVFVKVEGDTTGLTMNSDHWFTLGMVESMPGVTKPPQYVSGYQDKINGVTADQVKNRMTRYKPNKSINLDGITWMGFKSDRGASDTYDQYKNQYCWHLDGSINIEELKVNYTIRYVDENNNKEIASSKTKTGKAGSFTEVEREDIKDITGYTYTGYYDPMQKLIGGKDTVINVYYRPNSYSYRVEHYYDGEIDNSKTDTIHALYGSEVDKNTLTLKPKNGYEFEKTENCPLTIGTDESKNVIKVYYKKKADLSYTVKYLEKGTNKKLHNEKTVENQTFGAEITSASEKIDIDGYNYDSVEPEEKLTIGTGENVITFYYTKRNDLSYTVNYIDKDTGKAIINAKTVENQTFGAVIESEKEKIEIDGYNYDSVDKEKLTIGTGKNAITFYYTKRNDLSYTVNYLEKDTNKVLHEAKVKDGMTFEEVVNSADEVITIEGYNYDSVDKEKLTIGTGKNEINIYYTKRNDLSYTVNYLEKDTLNVLHNPKVQDGMMFDEVVNSADEVIEINGYNYDSVVPEETLTIGTGENVINIYYTKKTDLSYTVNYYWNGTNPLIPIKNSESGTETYGKTVNPDTDVPGYTLVPGQTTSLEIKDDPDQPNVLNLYYYKNVKLKANDTSRVYNGAKQTILSSEEYTVITTLDNQVVETTFDKEINVTGSGTDVGSNYTMYFPKKEIGIHNEQYYVVGYENGKLSITKRPVTLTSETAGKTYDGTALEKPVVTVGGDGFVEGQVTEIKATGSVTNAGSVANTITFTPNKETFKDGNYAITKTEGTLTIAKRSVLITSQSATKTYDGSALTRPAVTITGDGFVPGELAKAEATGSITKVGSTPNTIQYTTTGAFNAANYSIALSVGTLTVTEKPKPEPRRTFNLTINYVYQNGKRAAASYNRGGLKNGETFDITSPVIAGYTASETVVSGTIYNRDVKVTVIYTADGVNLDDYGVPLGLGNITMNVGDCFE